MNTSLESQELIESLNLCNFTKIEEYLDAFTQLDSYILEKEKTIKKIEKNILLETKEHNSLYKKLLDYTCDAQNIEQDLKNLEGDKKKIDVEEKKIFFYEKLLETAKYKIQIIDNQKDLDPEKYFTIEFYNGMIKIFIVYQLDDGNIVKITDEKGKILDKENIDWKAFDLEHPGNRNKIVLDIYQQYAP